MAKVLIQEGIQRLDSSALRGTNEDSSIKNREQFISALEAQQTRRLRGAPRRFKLLRPGN
ncbi:hypothetical protein EV05_0973 [Prochlorococcus sp. MIT 0601]|nr:hypothetical protein EV05_0973 [Prochlorococcus sp. MIT 0601]